MNKTININLAGIIFHLDEQAYAKLTTYLKSVKSKFSDDPGQEEILSDIEARIAELFSEKLTGAKEVVNIADVDEVIGVMGSPEDYSIDEEESSEEAKSESFTSGQNYNFGKRLYRNPDEKIIGGVSSGIAAYLGIDPIWIRIAWIFMIIAWGTGLLIYIILWIAMPEAKTTTQKLQMRGEPINISNIEKSVKDEFKNVSSRVSKVANDPKIGNKISSTVDDLVGIITSIFKFVFLLAFKLLGIALLIAGVFLLLTFIGGIFGHEIIINDNMFGWYDLNGYIDLLLISVNQRTLLFLGLFMMAVAPIVWLFMLGIRIVFNFKAQNRAAFILSAIISIVGFIMVTSVAFSMGRDFRIKSFYTESRLVDETENNTYHLTINNTIERPINDMEEDLDWIIEENNQYRKNIDFTIQKSDTKQMYLKLRNEAKGSSKLEARARAKNYEYIFDQQDSLLLFDNYFSMPLDEKFRAQKLSLILYVPIGTTVYIDEDLMEIIYDIPNVTHTYDYDMLNHNWLMTRNGLACLDCSAAEMEEDFDELWEKESELQEMEDALEKMEKKLEDIERQKEKLHELENELHKKEDELRSKTIKHFEAPRAPKDPKTLKSVKTSSSHTVQPIFLPQNSTINQEFNQLKGYQV